jgi:hypothetical protein
MLMLFLNAVFAVLFWSACTVAADEGRTGWAWIYLILSAWNGAAAFASIL